MNTAATTAFTIEQVELIVRDLARTRIFYEQVLGLHPVEESAGQLVLGAGGRGFVRLVERPRAVLPGPRGAGLFHTAFLMPSRGELARWLRHAVTTGVRLDGASDHGVSEAIYLNDPEGNGVEVYADRPHASWRWHNGLVQMPTRRLDVPGLLVDADEHAWTGVAASACIGHVHLQVGDTSRAQRFFVDELGLELTCRYPDARFFSRNGYHHHIAANSWNSAGAQPRGQDMAGLQRVVFGLEPGSAPARELADPWGVLYRLAPRDEPVAATL